MRYCRFTVLGQTKWGIALEDGIQPLLHSPYDGGIPPHYGDKLPPDAPTWEPPCAPRKIIAVGRNYSAHAAELGHEVPKEPLIFLKSPTALLPHEGEILLPTGLSAEVHHEVELAVVIARTTKNISLEEVPKAIFGYTIANDVTARDLQRQDGHFGRAKNFDTFCPVGPWIQTDFVPKDQKISLKVNGVTRQESRLDAMLFSVPELIVWLSRMMTLERGDLILTGTPAGVGPLHDGDLVEASIEGLGTLENTVKAAPAAV